MYVKVNDSPFVRDTHSMALINTDESAKNDYLMKSKVVNQQRQEMESVKKDVQEIKDLLLQLLTQR